MECIHPTKNMFNKNNTHKLLDRSEISDEYKWKLEDIYFSEDEWEEDFQKLKNIIPEIQGYKGKLEHSHENLLKALELNANMLRIVTNLYSYARMRRDEDNTNSHYQALTDRAQLIMTEVSSACAFIVPEILAIPHLTLKSFMEESHGLRLYKQYLDEIIRKKAHILSSKEEQILAQVEDLGEAAHNIFTMLNNADIKFPLIKNKEGEEVELTKGNYIQFMESNDRRVRKDAFTALYSTYSNQENTIASTLNSAIKRDVFFAKVRKYNSSLEASLDDDNISVAVFDNLINVINDNLQTMHKYMGIKKRMLNLDELHMYDIYAPLVSDVKFDIPYEESLDIIRQGLKPLGNEYDSMLQEGFASGWIDVFENKGKTGGAYSWGTYDAHPYVLLNYKNTLDSVFTTAHEMGHALHTYLSNKNQPFIYADYKIFVAEVASTVNETFLMKWFLNETEDPAKRTYLLNHYLEKFRATVFRQTKFAEFEKKIHEMIEAGNGLTTESLSQIYYDLNAKYYGPEVTYDKDIALEWSRIPHFYRNFYVYKYATGFCAAAALVKKILNEGKPAVDDYLAFLKSGSSDYPLNLLKKAGVDLFTPEPIKDAMDMFASLVHELGGE